MPTAGVPMLMEAFTLILTQPFSLSLIASRSSMLASELHLWRSGKAGGILTCPTLWSLPFENLLEKEPLAELKLKIKQIEPLLRRPLIQRRGCF
ncbi:hypothetical protein M0R45_017073 [Rubus argutus]|uniref:Uncharacterized protein n=1 Tax=Rubus argutus TaxID=59490 RepID=A0AAW1XTW4_RUBAR